MIGRAFVFAICLIAATIDASSALARWDVLAQGQPSQQPVLGRWAGAIKITGTEFSFQIEFSLAPPPVYSSSRQEILKGTIDIPQRLIRGAELTNIRFYPPTVHFEATIPISTPPAIFDGEFKNNQISGTYRQGEARGTFTLVRIKISK
jgi:hypothetical protein